MCHIEHFASIVNMHWIAFERRLACRNQLFHIDCAYETNEGTNERTRTHGRNTQHFFLNDCYAYLRSLHIWIFRSLARLLPHTGRRPKCVWFIIEPISREIFLVSNVTEKKYIYGRWVRLTVTTMSSSSSSSPNTFRSNIFLFFFSLFRSSLLSFRILWDVWARYFQYW